MLRASRRRLLASTAGALGLAALHTSLVAAAYSSDMASDGLGWIPRDPAGPDATSGADEPTSAATPTPAAASAATPTAVPAAPTTPAAPTPTSAPAPAAPPAAAPRGGASILGNNRLLTYYGNPEAASMGILGALSPGDLVGALQRRAATYQQVGGKPVLPAIHMVVTVAQGSPGPDGLYVARMPPALIKQYVDLAARNGMLFIADVQVGRSKVRDEVPVLAQFLQQPHVHLALDPEFDMWPGQVPGVELGHMTASEINWAMAFLGDVAASTGQRKIFMVHQFAASMLPDKAGIGRNPNLDFAIVMDGWGGQDVKINHYDVYCAASAIPYKGIKLFFDWDVGLMTAQQVLGLKPPPDVIIYQ